jgi:hypothetical protein
MVLKGRDKEAWWRFMQIKDTKKIPAALESIYAIDSNEDDNYIGSILRYVNEVNEIFLKGTCNTDACVKYMTGLRGLRKLTLSRNLAITPAALPGINRVHSLEYLDLTKTTIGPADLFLLTGLKKLTEIHVSTEMEEQQLPAEMMNRLKQNFPGCAIWINYQLIP